MQNFNITRFANTLRWQLAERKGLYTYAATGFILTALPTLIIPFLCGVFTQDYSNMEYISTASTIMIICATWYYLSCGALIVYDLGDKRKRINAFMLPASRLEKFSARYLHLLITLPLAFLIGFVACDLLQMGISQLFLGSSSSVLAQFVALSVDANTGISPLFGERLLAFVALFWFPHSLFLLLGSFFRRRAWILSNLILFLLSTMVFGGGAILGKALLDSCVESGIYRVGIITTPLATWLYTLAILVVIAFNYWAAFRIYSRMQAITNKTFNF